MILGSARRSGRTQPRTAVPEPILPSTSPAEASASYALRTVFREMPSRRASPRVEASNAPGGKPPFPIASRSASYSWRWSATRELRSSATAMAIGMGCLISGTLQMPSGSFQGYRFWGMLRKAGSRLGRNHVFQRQCHRVCLEYGRIRPFLLGGPGPETGLSVWRSLGFGGGRKRLDDRIAPGVRRVACRPQRIDDHRPGVERVDPG